MRQTTPTAIDFPLRKQTRVTFDGHPISSDGGVLLLRRLDDQLGLTERIAGALGDFRKDEGEHSVQEIVRARTFAIIQGYEDCNDVAALGKDALFREACRDGGTLPSQPTLSRFENGYSSDAIVRARSALLDHFIARHSTCAPRRLTLDIDLTDDPTHGQQEFAFFHGHYDSYCYLEMLIFSEEGDLLRAQLLPAKWDSRGAAVAALREVIHGLRTAWPQLELRIRADNGFACPALYDLCEDLHVEYIVNAGTHGVFQDKFASPSLLMKLEDRFVATEKTAKSFIRFTYKAKSWARSRTIIGKLQRTPLGFDTRFLITNLEGEPADIYEAYAGRGQAENWIKDFKRALKGDRLSCHAFRANALRLIIHAIAYQLAHELRRHAVGPLRHCQLDTLRLRILRVAALVYETTRKIWVRINSAMPEPEAWASIACSIQPVG